MLVRRYECDICFTPMIVANSFVKSAKARDSEFSTIEEDTPLIAQFAANNVADFSNAAEIIAPYCDGVDLNSGCPQRWAINEGYGVDMLKHPELVKDIVSQVRNRVPHPFTVSVKIRILKDIRRTVDFCQTLEKAGVSFLTVHARTPEMRYEPIHLDDLKIVRDSVQLPLIANGDVKNLENAQKLYEATNCQGIMSARGILTNPALFSGYTTTPLSCIQDWIDITARIDAHFLCFHHHLVFMTEKMLSKKDRVYLNSLKTRKSVLEFLGNHFDIRPSPSCDIIEQIFCDISESNIAYDNEKHAKNRQNMECNNIYIERDQSEIPNYLLGDLFQEA
ncbi:tRNA-dihydrouridine(20a/20b) synthase [NAD(P)+]-like isoform X2 [Vespa velutina]|nr:tRNA-dihydrouridine(20a/20b) synthase [NAD(P)+]-like isoform X2 [Vespa velutina]